MPIKKCLYLFLLLVISKTHYAQYTVNGNAAQISCNEYKLTSQANTQTGSVWNNNKIDLNQSFDFNFEVILSYPLPNDGGADGIAFVLQPISTSVGTSGSGLGYAGISPAVGITLDTYQNASDGDPTYDHIAYQLNGDLNHNASNNIAGPVRVLAGDDNVEDGNWHSLHIIWDALTKTLTTYVDGTLRLSAVKDLVTDVFSGNSFVYWGFTGSTGALNNYQGFKTALNPSFHFSPAQKRCVNEPITFYDSTISFTPLAKFWWDFGDGSPLDSVNLNPVHTYTTSGIFTVIQKVRGADGCEATNTVMVTIGSKPVAKFGYNDNCVVNIIQFRDSSTTAVGTLNNWYWDFDNGSTSILQFPSNSYTTGGDKTVKLSVKSLEGCESDTLFKTVHIYTRPVIDFNFSDSVCFGSPTSFFGTLISSNDPISDWSWNLGDTTTVPVRTQNVLYTFTTPGSHGVILLATCNGSAGCLGLVAKTVFVVNKPTAYFKNNIICQSTLITLIDSSYTSDGTPVNGYWWDLGNGQFSSSQNPTTTYNTAGPKIIKHVVYNSKGCISDTLTQTINVSAKPISNFGYSTPLCTGLPVQFSDSTIVTGGSASAWSWVYNGTEFSTLQNPNRIFIAGSQTVKLVTTSADGCVSDTASKTFIIQPSPDVNFSFSDACKNTSVNFSAIDNSGTVTDWKWAFGDGNIADAKDTIYAYSAGGIYNVKLYATASNGCYNDSLERSIIIYNTNAFAGNDTITPSGRPLQLHATGGVSYEWMPSAYLDNAFIQNPIATLTGTQIYTYVVKAYTPLGCESYDTIKIQVYQAPEIYLPGAFTPGGNNPLYHALPIGIKDFAYMKIFNRYGQEVFSTKDYLKGWDGTFKGKPQGNGVYVVIARGVDYRGLVVGRQATLMLIR